MIESAFSVDFFIPASNEPSSHACSRSLFSARIVCIPEDEKKHFRQTAAATGTTVQTEKG